MWLTQPQAAEILGVHPQTVAKLVARGELSSGVKAPGVPSIVTRCWLCGLLAKRLRIAVVDCRLSSTRAGDGFPETTLSW